jgi:hypothetical protein
MRSPPADLAHPSDGRSTYQDTRYSVRRCGKNSQQLFVSYVRSSARGELNDFMTLFTGLDQPLLQPGGMSQLSADARHRWLRMGTVNTPLGPRRLPGDGMAFGISVFDRGRALLLSRRAERRTYSGVQLAVDMIAYKTVT